MDFDPNAVEVNEITDIFSYLKSIDWANELWLYGILIFHAICAALAFLISLNFQIVLFMALCELSINFTYSVPFLNANFFYFQYYWFISQNI